MEALKNCPFCGSGRITLQQVCSEGNWTNHLESSEHKYFAVKCSECNAKGGVGMSGNNPLIAKTITDEEAKQIAVQKWNKRKDG